MKHFLLVFLITSFTFAAFAGDSKIENAVEELLDNIEKTPEFMHNGPLALKSLDTISSLESYINALDEIAPDSFLSLQEKTNKIKEDYINFLQTHIPKLIFTEFTEELNTRILYFEYPHLLNYQSLIEKKKELTKSEKLILREISKFERENDAFLELYHHYDFAPIMQTYSENKALNKDLAAKLYKDDSLASGIINKITSKDISGKNNISDIISFFEGQQLLFASQPEDKKVDNITKMMDAAFYKTALKIFDPNLFPYKSNDKEYMISNIQQFIDVLDELTLRIKKNPDSEQSRNYQRLAKEIRQAYTKSSNKTVKTFYYDFLKKHRRKNLIHYLEPGTAEYESEFIETIFYRLLNLEDPPMNIHAFKRTKDELNGHKIYISDGQKEYFYEALKVVDETNDLIHQIIRKSHSEKESLLHAQSVEKFYEFLIDELSPRNSTRKFLGDTFLSKYDEIITKTWIGHILINLTKFDRQDAKYTALFERTDNKLLNNLMALLHDISFNSQKYLVSSSALDQVFNLLIKQVKLTLISNPDLISDFTSLTHGFFINQNSHSINTHKKVVSFLMNLSVDSNLTQENTSSMVKTLVFYHDNTRHQEIKNDIVEFLYKNSEVLPLEKTRAIQILEKNREICAKMLSK